MSVVHPLHPRDARPPFEFHEADARRFYAAVAPMATPGVFWIMGGFRNRGPKDPKGGTDIPIYPERMGGRPRAIVLEDRDAFLDGWIETCRGASNLALAQPTVAVACPYPGGFHTPANTDAANLAELYFLLLDADDAPKATLAKAIQRLGEPTFLGQSGGIGKNPDTGAGDDKAHAYWLLDRAAKREDLERANTCIKALNTIGGGDRTMTGVHALRLIGSWNTKGAEPRLCCIVGGDETRRITLDEAEAGLRDLMGRSRSKRTKANGDELGIEPDENAELVRQIMTGKAYRTPLRSLAYRMIKDGTPPPTVENHLCALMRAVPDEARDEGPGGSHRQGRWVERFAEIPTLVESARASVAEEMAEAAEAPASEDAGDAANENEDAAPRVVWPRGYSMPPGGLTFHPGDTKTPQTLCAPFEIIASATSENGARRFTIVGVNGPQGAREEIISASECHTNDKGVAGRLEDAGLHIASSNRAKILDAIAGATCSRHETIISHGGWTKDGGAFVTPRGEIIARPGARRAYRYLAPDGSTPALNAGTLEGALSVTALASGNPLMVKAFCLQFAGPTMRAFEIPSNIVHFFDKSSRGKTTNAVAGLFVWDNPYRLPSWLTTENAIESVLSLRSEAGAVLDEVHKADPNKMDLGKVIYTIAEGGGKHRQERHGGGLREELEWTVMVHSTGEHRITDHMKRARFGGTVTAGMNVRAIELPGIESDARGAFKTFHHLEPGDDADLSKAGEKLKKAGQAFTAEIVKLARANWGHLGPAYVRALVLDYEGELARMRADMAAFMDELPPGIDNQGRRVAKVMAFLGAVGESARRLLGLPWAEGEALAAWKRAFMGTKAKDGYSGWLELHGKTAREEVLALDRLSRLLDAREQSFDDDAKDAVRTDAQGEEISRTAFRPAQPLLGVIWRHEGATFFCLTKDAFEGVAGELGRERLAAEIERIGALHLNRTRGKQAKVTFRGDAWNVYAVNRAALRDYLDAQAHGDDAVDEDEAL